MKSKEVRRKLKKNKKYYYQAKHFTAVSGMVYRMKQNAVGLANICILSTMVIVLVSMTVSLYAGMSDILAARFPSPAKIEIFSTNEEEEQQVKQILKEETEKENVKVVGTVGTRLLNGSVSLMYQGFWLFPPALLSSGYKVGTVGTKAGVSPITQCCSHLYPPSFTEVGTAQTQ